jgi:hypothetical protein
MKLRQSRRHGVEDQTKEQALLKKEKALEKTLMQFDKLVAEGTLLENLGSRQLSVLTLDSSVFRN